MFSVDLCRDHCWVAPRTRQWTGRAAIMWEIQQVRMQQWRSCVFCVAWSMPRLYKWVKFHNPPQRIRPCDVQKLIKSLILRKACGIDGIPNEWLRHFPRCPLVHLTHLFNHCLRLPLFPNPWKEAKLITLPKPGKDPKSLKICIRSASCPRQVNCSKK
jgi:hypothetical protein